MLQLYYVIGQAGHLKDISWPSSPMGTVSCTALFVLCHRTGQPPDISWPSSPIGGEGGGRRRGGGGGGTEENHTTSTLTVGKTRSFGD